MKWELWNTAEIAERTGYTRRYVEEKIVARPDFPVPICVAGVGRPRWESSEVQAWFRQWKQVA